ncbi:MAG: AraC family transcriptional regulator [Cyclobacteriaceae bacterium]
MQNVYTDILADMSYNKFVVKELLFVEYTCPIKDDQWSVWSQTDFIIHVLKGKKKLSVGDESWMVEEGDTVYIRKGSFTMSQYFDKEFCMFGFFINDNFIKSIVEELKGRVAFVARAQHKNFSIRPIVSSPILQGFFNSMIPFFRKEQSPSNLLLELKLKELVVSFLTSNENPELSSYFQAMVDLEKPSLQSIMETNFSQNLTLTEYAELCHRSLSSFKRDFQASYGTTPGKWLIDRRLQFAKNLLINEDLTIAQIAYQSGFENSSHFSRSFKEVYGKTPSDHRLSRG